MPDIFYLASRWWKPMLVMLLISLITVGVIIVLKPNQYLSVATALPASSVSADKASIFNENIEGLYSDLGSPDDLDRIIGTAQLDTVYLAVTDQFNLYDHYKITKGDEQARIKAARILKKCTRVFKSEYGELKVKAWDTDKNLAPQLANAILYKLEAIHQDLQSINNRATVKSLQLSLHKIQLQTDSIDRIKDLTKSGTAMLEMHRKVLFEQLQQHEKLIGEYELMLENKPPVLMLVEKARPAIHAGKPRRVQIMIVTAFLSLFFGLLVALVMERRKTNPQ